MCHRYDTLSEKVGHVILFCQQAVDHDVNTYAARLDHVIVSKAEITHRWVSDIMRNKLDTVRCVGQCTTSMLYGTCSKTHSAQLPDQCTNFDKSQRNTLPHARSADVIATSSSNPFTCRIQARTTLSDSRLVNRKNVQCDIIIDRKSVV